MCRNTFTQKQSKVDEIDKNAVLILIFITLVKHSLRPWQVSLAMIPGPVLQLLSLVLDDRRNIDHAKQGHC